MVVVLILLIFSMGLLFLVLHQFESYFNDGDEQASAKKEELAASIAKVNRIEQRLGAAVTALILGAEAGISVLIQLSVCAFFSEGWMGGFTTMVVMIVSGYFGVWIFRLCLKKQWLGNLLGGVAVLGIIALLILRWLYIHGMPSDLTTLIEQLF
ncbi:hypothetical protein P3T73_16695 [Kiritimatiellota bacterium B12222]|nr:hypothetical protein P3T73_16695 [Kiritimatiellota bacterium B12222]